MTAAPRVPARHATLVVARVLLVVFALAGGAWAHGGIIIIPTDPKPPDHKGGVAPPSDAGRLNGPLGNNGATPGPGPGSGASGIRGAETNAGRSARGTSGRVAGAVSGRERATFVLDEGSWERWWEVNRDGYLNLREQLAHRRTSGSVGALTGRGRRLDRRPAHGADRATIDAVIIPRLVDLLQTSGERDVLDSAALAAARSARENMQARVLHGLLPLLEHDELTVQRSVTLALGALGSDEGRASLRALLRDDSEGRALTGGEVPTETRAFAALALGLIGRPVDARLLVQVVDRSPDSQREVKATCVVALGLLGASEDVADGVQGHLVGLLLDPRLDPMVRGHVPTALARTGDRDVLPELLAAFHDRDAAYQVRRSSAIAFGRLATPADTDVVETLLDVVAAARDVHLRHFALIALGEIAGREPPAEMVADPGAAPDPWSVSDGPEVSEVTLTVSPRMVAETRDRIERRLALEVQGRGKSREQRSWGALAAALYGRALPARQPVVRQLLRQAYVDESDPRAKGAVAIALGLLGDEDVADVLLTDFHEVKDHRFRGHAAVALGMLDHVPVADELLPLFEDASTHPELQVEAAVALGMLGGTRQLEVLIDGLRDSRSLGVTAGLTRALGLVGDSAAVEPLLLLSGDGTRPALSRGFACVALGLLGARSELPFQSAVLAHEDYLSECVALAELRSIL